MHPQLEDRREHDAHGGRRNVEATQLGLEDAAAQPKAGPRLKGERETIDRAMQLAPERGGDLEPTRQAQELHDASDGPAPVHEGISDEVEVAPLGELLMERRRHGDSQCSNQLFYRHTQLTVHLAMADQIDERDHLRAQLRASDVDGNGGEQPSGNYSGGAAVSPVSEGGIGGGAQAPTA